MGSVIGSSVLGEGTKSPHRRTQHENDQIKEIISKATEQLIAALNEGRSETLTAYLTAMANFRRYSLRNVMLFASQKPTATRVAGFTLGISLGASRRKARKASSLSRRLSVARKVAAHVLECRRRGVASAVAEQRACLVGAALCGRSVPQSRLTFRMLPFPQ